MDCETFDILGRWEIDRGTQNLHYDFWWNLPRDYAELYATRIRSRAIGFTYARNRFSTIFVGFMAAFFLRNYGTLGVFAYRRSTPASPKR
jgi:hypothetical protein